MTRKDFQLIAAAIASCPAFQGTEHVDRRTLAQHFATALRATNPNFNAERFVEACTVTKGGPANLKRLRQLHTEAAAGEEG